MAIYHLSAGLVSRSTGRSSVQSAAYITGEQLHESRRDLNINYKNRHSDIAFTDTLAPEHAPEHFKNIKVWDYLENFEDEYALKRFPNSLESRDKYLNSAQTAQTIVVALPRELGVGVAKELVEEFTLTRFVNRGLIVTYAIHDDEGNPHAHLMISRRCVGENGELSWAKDREIVSRKELLVTRKLWADLTNHYLEREGFDARITEKSFADLGLNLEPSKHRGWVADKLEGMGVNSRIVDENSEIFTRNREELIETPAVILPEMTSKFATFTQMHLLKAIQKRVGDNDKVLASVFETALQQAVVVGEGMDGQIRYTTQNYKDIETEAINQVSELLTTPFEQNRLDKNNSNEYLGNNFAYLSPEQQTAVKGLIQDQQLAVLVGRAGAGKTTILKAVSEIYQQAGYKVLGTSLSAMAADNLQKETGVKSATMHSLLYRWQRYDSAKNAFLSFDSVMEEGLFKQLSWYQDLKRFATMQLTKESVLIVDEAGMIGTHQWSELLHYVQRSGAKLIAVGDDNQFKSIAAGDFFREIKQQTERTQQLYHLQAIRRQKHDWMKEASQQLAELNIQEGLSVYEQRGHVHQTTKADLAEEIAAAYFDKLSQTTNEGKSPEGLVLAFTNKQTKEINAAIREKLKQTGLINKQDIANINGKNFAIGDRIVFLENDKTRLPVIDVHGVVTQDSYIKNGTQGTIQGLDDQGGISIKLDDNCYTIIKQIDAHTPKVAIGQPNPEAAKIYNYTHIAHGYAVTTHKAQGQTVDFTIVAASKHMTAQGLYVAMTRHRDDVQLFYVKEDFLSFKALTNQLSRFEAKDLVKDYTIRPENEANWQRVQEYLLCILDAAVVAKENDWATYHQIKQDQVTLGKKILSTFESHKLYINQAGLTQEMLEITTGQKPRPLSLVEEKAKVTVELYGETAQLARSIWNSIRRSHPGSKCYSHPAYEKFNEIRHERNSLAQIIAENYPLNREFINQFSRVYGINSKTVEAQSRQFRESQSTYKYSKKENELWYYNNSYNQDYGKYATSKSHNIGKENQLDQGVQSKDYRQKSLDTKFIKQELDSRIKDLAYQFLGQPNQQKATEWRYGNKGSISIHVAGHKQGLYSNFETGESGNALKLIQDQLNLDHKQAFKWGAEWLGQNYNHTLHQRHTEKERTIPQQTTQAWQPIYPAPNHNVEIASEKSLAYMLKGRQEIARYTYKDADNNILGYVMRLEDKQGHKITPTLTYCLNQDGKEQWRWQGFGNERPLYGLEQLKEKQDAKVLIVEGEKTCELARSLFPDYAVVTWSGGCGAVNKSDWTVLKKRDITIWPDNDKPGINAAAKIAGILKEQGNNSVKIVDLPPTLPHKWDLADKLPYRLDAREILNNQSRIPNKEKDLKGLPDSLIYKDKIEQIICQHKLETTFGSLNNADYQNVYKVFDILKDAYQLAKIKTEDDWTLKRAIFMVYNLREFSNLPMTDEERARTCLVAATIFANQNERTDTTTTYDNHFKAVGMINTHNQSKDHYIQAENNFKEIFGFQPNAPLEVRQNYVPVLQDKIFSEIKQLHTQYQQRSLEIASKNLDMQKGKDLEL